MGTQEADRPPRDAGRYSKLAPDGSARFTCAACEGLAAVVRLVPAGTTFDMAPPTGPEQQDRDGVTITQWLSGPSWQAVNPSTWAKIPATSGL